MIPMKFLTLEHDISDYSKYQYGERFLNDLELHEIEWTSIPFEANAIGWNEKTVFDEGNGPREDNDTNKWPIGTYTALLKFQMTIPSEGHKNVTAYK